MESEKGVGGGCYTVLGGGRAMMGQRERGGDRGVIRENMVCFMNNTRTHACTSAWPISAIFQVSAGWIQCDYRLQYILYTTQKP